MEGGDVPVYNSNSHFTKEVKNQARNERKMRRKETLWVSPSRGNSTDRKKKILVGQEVEWGKKGEQARKILGGDRVSGRSPVRRWTSFDRQKRGDWEGISIRTGAGEKGTGGEISSRRETRVFTWAYCLGKIVPKWGKEEKPGPLPRGKKEIPAASLVQKTSKLRNPPLTLLSFMGGRKKNSRVRELYKPGEVGVLRTLPHVQAFGVVCGGGCFQVFKNKVSRLHPQDPNKLQRRRGQEKGSGDLEKEKKQQVFREERDRVAGGKMELP